MKTVGIILIYALLFTGCTATADTPAHRVVTGAQVEYSQSGTTINRTYTRSASIQSVLTYLRILRPHGPVIPRDTEDSTCRITLHYSHGPDSVYFQRGNDYLQRDGGSWESIDDTSASLLYPMLLLLPSDG